MSANLGISAHQVKRIVVEDNRSKDDGTLRFRDFEFYDDDDNLILTVTAFAARVDRYNLDEGYQPQNLEFADGNAY